MTTVLVLLAAGLTLIAGAPNPTQQYNVTILEGGVLIKEQVQLLPDLHVYHVPQHHDLEHVKVFLDFRNRLMLVSYLDLGRCELSELDEQMPDNTQRRLALHQLKNYIVYAGNSKERRFASLRSPEALSDVSFLRKELQDACANMPVYTVRRFDVTDKNSTFLIPADEATVTRHRRTPIKVTTTVRCGVSDLFQTCKVAVTGKSCFYVITCATVQPSQQCMTHLRDNNLDCKVCCAAKGATATSVPPKCPPP